MDNRLPANPSALAIADNCIVDSEISAENLAVIECVLRILDGGIEKLQIAMIIPAFLDDQDVLKQCLTKPGLQKCIKYYNEYMRHAELMRDTDQKQLHIALIELIDLFCENPRIKEILPEHIEKISNEHKELINALVQLRQIAEVKLKTTVTVEMRRERAVHRIYLDNESVLNNISKQKKKLHSQEISLRWKMAAKLALIKKYEDDLAMQKWENNLKIKQEILRSSHKIHDFHTNSLIKQEQLAECVRKAEAYYTRDINMNVKTENYVRDEKNKLLLQLQGLIKKYDQNIGDKIQEDSDLQNLYEDQRRKLDEFLVGYAEREKEYNELLQKKIDEEAAEFERKLFLFMSVRAAKIIQHYWRKYWKTKKRYSKSTGEDGRKKGKGKEKGKKKK